jgi:glycosyltransferase involved in cell wall biosynthesis
MVGEFDVLRRIGVIGNYLPRRCGIATFTTGLCEALAAEAPEARIAAIAMNDIPEGYRYPPRVRFEVEESNLRDYELAAGFLNMNRFDLVCVQHEYGIFGGDFGSHILVLLRDLRMPIITTLHTVLKDPGDEQRAILKDLVKLSDRVVVMSETAVAFLKDIYKVPESKIALIHHGIPDVPFVDPNYYKDLLGVEGRRMILTFGLLSPGKGTSTRLRLFRGRWRILSEAARR